jgi:hypothetical protein
MFPLVQLRFRLPFYKYLFINDFIFINDLILSFFIDPGKKTISSKIFPRMRTGYANRLLVVYFSTCEPKITMTEQRLSLSQRRDNNL